MGIPQPLIVIIGTDLGGEEIEQEFSGQGAERLIQLVGEIALKAGNHGCLLLLRKGDLLHLSISHFASGLQALDQGNQLIHQGNSIAGSTGTAYTSGH